MIPVTHIRLLRIMAARLTTASAAADPASVVTAAADPASVVTAAANPASVVTAAADPASGVTAAAHPASVVTAAADPATSDTAAAANAPSTSGIDVASDQSRIAPSLAGRDILYIASREYNRLAAQHFVSFLPRRTGLVVLDIGAGSGGTAIAVLEALEKQKVDDAIVCSVDNNPDMETLYHRNAELSGQPAAQIFINNMLALPLKDNTMHGAISVFGCSNLTLLQPDGKVNVRPVRDAMIEARRVLQIGAPFLLMTWLETPDGRKYPPLSLLCGMLGQAGFTDPVFCQEVALADDKHDVIQHCPDQLWDSVEDAEQFGTLSTAGKQLLLRQMFNPKLNPALCHVRVGIIAVTAA
jgi:ubiquinone/menaquinone biosynthesis C-methylase UbiE